MCGIQGELLSASFTVCRRHSLGHRNGREPEAQHHCTPNSSEGVQAGTNTMAISRKTAGCKVEVEGHASVERGM